MLGKLGLHGLKKTIRVKHRIKYLSSGTSFNTLNTQVKGKNYLQIDFSGTSQILQLGWLYQYIDFILCQVEVEGETGDKIFWTVLCFNNANIRDFAATKTDKTRFH